MRIRKRQVPLPFSSLSPLPLSDPLLPHSPPVQLPPSSDPPNLLPFSSHNALDKNQKLQQHDSRETTLIIGAEITINGVLPQSTSSSQVGGGRWCEREKTFPLKKRRGSFERLSDDQDYDDEQDDNKHGQVDTATTVKLLSEEKKPMKTKVNKKCTLSQKQSKLGLDLAGKKRSRGGALMEGSRCSRVNGRGWRCCQQTLVGYSLCEHHLGKGRLRSMNNVRNRSLAAAIATPKNIVIVDKDEKKPSLSPSPFPPPPSSSLTLASKKRMKLGVVKARSISSLLGQPDGMVVISPLPPPAPMLHDDNIDN